MTGSKDHQIQTAAHFVRSLVESIMESESVPEGFIYSDGLKEFVSQLEDESFSNAQSGKSRMCVHLDSNPQPVVVFYHDVHTLLCFSCGDLHVEFLSKSLENFRCDRCYQIVDLIHPVIHQNGLVVFQGGFCKGCVTT
jgi:hypothetical protein